MKQPMKQGRMCNVFIW